MDATEQVRIHRELQRISHAWLDFFKIDHEPHRPKIRTRKWADKVGPLGVAYHFTGGPSGLKTAKWFNKPSWGNEVSSCHVLIFDRCAGEPGAVWRDLASREMLSLFPVPTIILANWRWGTWTTNWANSYTLGVELQNCGPNIRANRGGDYYISPKTALQIGGIYWEEYTREQMAAAINIGRMVRAWRGDDFDPDWVIGHQCIWATKSDPGPLFPIDLVRLAITEDQDPSTLDWLSGLPEAPNVDEDYKTWWHITSENRDDATDQFWLHLPNKNELIDLRKDGAIASDLYLLGYNAFPETLTKEKFHKFISWFQRSTEAYSSKKRLPITHMPDSRTIFALRERLRSLQMF
jgi:N-acetyl-anhydromuramyl-L-alanine amidase AmpD